MESQKDAASLLAAYDDDFVGFAGSSAEAPGGGATLGGAEPLDPDHLYAEFSSQLLSFARAHPNVKDIAGTVVIEMDYSDEPRDRGDDGGDSSGDGDSDYGSQDETGCDCCGEAAPTGGAELSDDDAAIGDMDESALEGDTFGPAGVEDDNLGMRSHDDWAEDGPFALSDVAVDAPDAPEGDSFTLLGAAVSDDDARDDARDDAHDTDIFRFAVEL